MTLGIVGFTAALTVGCGAGLMVLTLDGFSGAGLTATGAGLGVFVVGAVVALVIPLEGLVVPLEA